MYKWICLLLLLAGCDLVNNNDTIDSTIIVLTFDDGSKSIYELALPLMQEYGYRGVDFIPTGWINQPGIMTLDQVCKLEENGWETGGHTVHHTNLTTVSLDSARAEISDNYNQLVGLGLKHRCFALPAGHSSPETTEIIKQYFSIIRTSQNERYSYPLNLDRLGYYQVQNNDDPNSLLMRVAHGINNHECLIIFGFHLFTNDEPTFITMIRISVFKEFLEGLKKRNLRVMTLSDAVDKLQK